MERRDLIRAFGAATALALLPSEAAAAWARVASGLHMPGLSPAALATVDAIADAIIPRTDSPSASDVGVSAFIDVIVTENYSDDDRAAFLAGLQTIEMQIASGVEPAIAAIEATGDRRAEPQRTYWRLKGLIVHGYFTSERIQKDVLKVNIMPGAFNGNAPLPGAAP